MLVRLLLLLFAFAGLLASIFWDEIFTTPSNPNSSCPFSGKNQVSDLQSTFAQILHSLPDTDQVFDSNKDCLSCIFVDKMVFDMGDLKSKFFDGKKEVTLEEATNMYGADSHSSHAKQGVLKMFQAKFPWSSTT